MGKKWTGGNTRKLYAAMRSNLPEQCRTLSYHRVLKGLDWSTVAFPPFSAEECQKKWRQVLRKMRKFRSLTELIDEAECVLSNAHQQSETLTAAEQKGYRTSNPRKYKYIDATQRWNHKMEEQNNHEMEEQNSHKTQQLCLNRPSDSEDEDIEDSSSDEEEDDLDSDEDEEEDEGVITFEIY